MKVYQKNSDFNLNDFLSKKLKLYRKERNFDPKKYLDIKSKVINNYFSKFNIKKVIVSLSGGVDSATVLGILKYTSNKFKTFDIVAVNSCTFNDYVSNQERAYEYSKKQAEKLNIPFSLIDLTKISSDFNNIVENSINELLYNNPIVSSSWSKGQLVPYLRTPLNYYLATLFNDIEGTTIICGTTNRDEGAYLGYVGKASDYIVDIQIISDLHKSEVYKIAKLVGVIDEIMNVIPDGDMYDKRTDTEVFGASYDFVELYHNYLNKDENYRKELEKDSLFMLFKENIEKLHYYNSHKYLIGSPAVHLDIMDSGVNNGWKLDFSNKYYDNLKKQGNIHKPQFVNPITFNNEYLKNLNTFQNKKYNINYVDEHSFYIDDFFNENEIFTLINIYKSHNSYTTANSHGYKSYELEDIMSLRKSLYSIELSEFLFNNIKMFDLVEAKTPITDWNENEIFKYIGINPLFRYIDYVNNGYLTSHYDYSFKETEKIKSLWSLVIYLTDSEDGETCFLEDNQKDNWNKNLDDQLFINESKIITKIIPKKGRILVFPHHYLHCGLKSNNEKLIIRTDLMFEKI